MTRGRRGSGASGADRRRGWIRRWGERLAPWGTRRRTLAQVPTRVIRAARELGVLRFLARVLAVWRWLPELFRPAVPEGGFPIEEYDLWARLRHRPRPAVLRREAERLGRRPTISVVMPVHDTPAEWLRAAIGSVTGQIYPHWELCIADDASTREETLAVLGGLEGSDPRIRTVRSEQGRGIVGASIAGLGLASGEFVTFLDHDDELKPEALLEVARVLDDEPGLDFIYTDEDKREPDGRLVEPFLKPDWSPDLLMSVNYVNHLSVYRRRVLEEAGGLREEFEGSQDYDLVLRVTERTGNIAHLAEPLYTWRKVPGSAAESIEGKSYARAAARRALESALGRRGIEGRVDEGLIAGRYAVRYAIRGAPTVTIVIPTRDRVDLLRPCIESIRERTTYQPYELVVVDNDSRDPATLEYLRSAPVTVLRYPGPFNYAEMMNAAVVEIGDTDLVLFLNNDTRVDAPEWLEAMVEHGQRPEVGVTGARLLYPDGRPQHEGIVVGLRGGVAHNVDFGGVDGLGETIRNCSAVTFACALVRPEVFRELGGLEPGLSVAFNDVDFCLRAREKGYEVVYTPHARLIHHERATRRETPHEEDEAIFRARWGDYRDPYYNPNFNILRPFHLRVDA